MPWFSMNVRKRRYDTKEEKNRSKRRRKHNRNDNNNNQNDKKRPTARTPRKIDVCRTTTRDQLIILSGLYVPYAQCLYAVPMCLGTECFIECLL